jgi:hypothetical protein
MLKIGLSALVTATLCFGIVAATGFASRNTQDARIIGLKVGDIVRMPTNNFQCQVLTRKQVACGRKTLASSVVVYFQPGQLDVVRTNKKGTGGEVIFKIKR